MTHHPLAAVADAAHAFLAPSSAHRWVRCAGSAGLEAQYPEQETSPEAAAGTACHWVFAQMFQGRPVTVDEVAPNGVPIDAAMIEAAGLVYHDVVTTLGPRWSERLMVEQRVAIPRVHPQNWGTPDLRAWAQDSAGRWVLHVWDFKYGHKLVEHYENWQLIDYVAGALSETAGLDDQAVKVVMTVIQPRAYHREGPVRRWTVMASDLRGQINRLAMAAEDATSVSPTFSPHPDACENCRGRHACEALQRASYHAMDVAQRSQPLALSPHALGLELRMLHRAAALMSARISGLEEHAISLIKQGQPVAWFAMAPTQGRVKWTVPTDQVLMLGELAGVDFAKPPEPITPKQASDRAPALAATITAMSKRESSMQLIADDGSKARQVFTAPE